VHTSGITASFWMKGVGSSGIHWRNNNWASSRQERSFVVTALGWNEQPQRPPGWRGMIRSDLISYKHTNDTEPIAFSGFSIYCVIFKCFIFKHALQIRAK
jgi:hypothetical protein